MSTSIDPVVGLATPVPEPAALAMLASSLAGFVLMLGAPRGRSQRLT